MGNLLTATIVIVLVNVLMWFTSIAMMDINPNGDQCFSLDGSIIGEQVAKTSSNYIINGSFIDDLPGAEGTISPSSGNVFTDIFNNILGWLKSAPGIKYIYGVVASPYNILKCTGLPELFIVGLGTLWYLLSFLVLISYLWGRE